MLTSNFLIFLSMAFFGGNTVVMQPQGMANQYIGAEKCKICHNKEATGGQYAKWTASKHSQAMKLLTGDDATNPKCLKCHSTYGGIEDAGLIATLTKEEGVSCESCHGPGSTYKAMSTMQDKTAAIAAGLIVPDEALCKKCHNEESPNFKGFDYATYLEKIAHPNPAK